MIPPDQAADLRLAIALTGISARELWCACVGYGSSHIDLDEFARAFAQPSTLCASEATIARIVLNERLDDMGLPALA